MKKYLIASSLLLALGACSESEDHASSYSASAVSAPVKTYSAEAFFNTTSFAPASSAGFSFSPDGKSILVTSDESGVFNSYAVNAETGERTQLTASRSSSNFGLTYFPGDARMLFTADGGGDELNHIWVRELDGSIRDLTATEKTKASFAGWSANKSEFYISTNERDARAFDLYAYKADGYTRRMVFENTDALALSGGSRDGRWLALTKSRTSADSNVYLVDLEKGGVPKLVTEHTGNIAYGSYGFTPDSEWLILSTNEHGEFNQAWAYNMLDGRMAEYATADWDISFVGFSKTGKYKYVGVNADAQTELAITEMATGKAVTMPAPDGNVSGLRFTPDDSQVAFMLASDTSPSDLYTVKLGTDISAKRLTTALNPEINQADLVASTVIRYDSFDGTKIPSILYRPKGASADAKVPAVVLVHGGPGGQTRRGYRAMVQHLVNHGYAVLGANNRGSSGYGKTFNHMDDKRHGEGDLQDIIMGRKYLESLDWIDGDKVGIMGGSYGGYMVAAALAFEPEAFEVGVNIFGVTNWVRTLKSIPPWWESFRESLYDEMGDPATDEERHRRISPLFHTEHINKPLLVIQGANDPRVLQVESDELVAKVKANGVPVEYILFPDEGHGFRVKANRIIASDAYITFLDQYLKGAK
ncbi:MAG: S9 family peptidase [Kordiimonadales bacterium]|nr:MAG: S9 family peptidase [Kordiimonadales bacterium]